MAYVGLMRVVQYLSAPSEIRGLKWVHLCHARVVVLHQLGGIKVPLNVGGLHMRNLSQMSAVDQRLAVG